MNRFWGSLRKAGKDGYLLCNDIQTKLMTMMRQEQALRVYTVRPSLHFRLDIIIIQMWILPMQHDFFSF